MNIYLTKKQADHVGTVLRGELLRIESQEDMANFERKRKPILERILTKINLAERKELGLKQKVKAIGD